MKIGVFAYNFPHWKTQNGIQNLCIAGYKPEVIFAADPVKLKFYKSQLRLTPKDLFLWHPKQIADHYNIDYCVVKHNSSETSQIVKNKNLNIGIMLGARILKPIAFNNFSIGVINMHPGILPENRGLDNIKWAILNNQPQGVTTHIIDSQIDRGQKILQDTIEVYQDDTLLDIHLRLQNLEQKLMIDSIVYLQNNGKEQLMNLNEGVYNQSVPSFIEQKLLDSFNQYKQEYSSCHR